MWTGYNIDRDKSTNATSLNPWTTVDDADSDSESICSLSSTEVFSSSDFCKQQKNAYSLGLSLLAIGSFDETASSADILSVVVQSTGEVVRATSNYDDTTTHWLPPSPHIFELEPGKILTSIISLYYLSLYNLGIALFRLSLDADDSTKLPLALRGVTSLYLSCLGLDGQDGKNVKSNVYGSINRWADLAGVNGSTTGIAFVESLVAAIELENDDFNYVDDFEPSILLPPPVPLSLLPYLKRVALGASSSIYPTKLPERHPIWRGVLDEFGGCRNSPAAGATATSTITPTKIATKATMETTKAPPPPKPTFSAYINTVMSSRSTNFHQLPSALFLPPSALYLISDAFLPSERVVVCVCSAWRDAVESKRRQKWLSGRVDARDGTEMSGGLGLGLGLGLGKTSSLMDLDSGEENEDSDDDDSSSSSCSDDSISPSPSKSKSKSPTSLSNDGDMPKSPDLATRKSARRMAAISQGKDGESSAQARKISLKHIILRCIDWEEARTTDADCRGKIAGWWGDREQLQQQYRSDDNLSSRAASRAASPITANKPAFVINEPQTAAYKLSYKDYDTTLRQIILTPHENLPKLLRALDSLMSTSSTSPETNQVFESICPPPETLRPLESRLPNSSSSDDGLMSSKILTSLSMTDSWWITLESRKGFLHALASMLRFLRAEDANHLDRSLLLLEGELMLRSMEEVAFVAKSPSVQYFDMLLGEILPRLEEEFSKDDTSSLNWTTRCGFLLGRAEYILWRIGGGEGEEGLIRRAATFDENAVGAEENTFYGQYHLVVESYRSRTIKDKGLGGDDDGGDCERDSSFLPNALLIRHENRCIHFFETTCKALLDYGLVSTPHLSSLPRAVELAAHGCNDCCSDWTFLNAESLQRHIERAKGLFFHCGLVREREESAKRASELSRNNSYDHDKFVRDVARPKIAEWTSSAADKKSLARSMLLDFALINKSVLVDLAKKDLRRTSIFGNCGSKKKRTKQTSILTTLFEMDFEEETERTSVGAIFLAVGALTIELYLEGREGTEGGAGRKIGSPMLADKNVLLFLASMFIDAGSTLGGDDFIDACGTLIGLLVSTFVDDTTKTQRERFLFANLLVTSRKLNGAALINALAESLANLHSKYWKRRKDASKARRKLSELTAKGKNNPQEQIFARMLRGRSEKANEAKGSLSTIINIVEFVAQELALAVTRNEPVVRTAADDRSFSIDVSSPLENHLVALSSVLKFLLEVFEQDSSLSAVGAAIAAITTFCFCDGDTDDADFVVSDGESHCNDSPNKVKFSRMISDRVEVVANILDREATEDGNDSISSRMEFWKHPTDNNFVAHDISVVRNVEHKVFVHALSFLGEASMILHGGDIWSPQYPRGSRTLGEKIDDYLAVSYRKIYGFDLLSIAGGGEQTLRTKFETKPPSAEKTASLFRFLLRFRAAVRKTSTVVEETRKGFEICRKGIVGNKRVGGDFFDFVFRGVGVDNVSAFAEKIETSGSCDSDYTEDGLRILRQVYSELSRGMPIPAENSTVGGFGEDEGGDYCLSVSNVVNLPWEACNPPLRAEAEILAPPMIPPDCIPEMRANDANFELRCRKKINMGLYALELSRGANTRGDDEFRAQTCLELARTFDAMSKFILDRISVTDETESGGKMSTHPPSAATVSDYCRGSPLFPRRIIEPCEDSAGSSGGVRPPVCDDLSPFAGAISYSEQGECGGPWSILGGIGATARRVADLGGRKEVLESLQKLVVQPGGEQQHWGEFQTSWGCQYLCAFRTMQKRCLDLCLALGGKEGEVLPELATISYRELQGKQDLGDIGRRRLTRLERVELASDSLSLFERILLLSNNVLSSPRWQTLLMMGKCYEKIAEAYGDYEGGGGTFGDGNWGDCEGSYLKYMKRGLTCYALGFDGLRGGDDKSDLLGIICDDESVFKLSCNLPSGKNSPSQLKFLFPDGNSGTGSALLGGSKNGPIEILYRFLAARAKVIVRAVGSHPYLCSKRSDASDNNSDTESDGEMDVEADTAISFSVWRRREENACKLLEVGLDEKVGWGEEDDDDDDVRFNMVNHLELTKSLLQRCRSINPYFHRSLYRQAQLVLWAPCVSDPTSFSTDDAAYEAMKVLAQLTERKHPQIVGVWVTLSGNEYECSGFERINSSATKFNSLRSKYLGALGRLCERVACGDSEHEVREAAIDKIKVLLDRAKNIKGGRDHCNWYWQSSIGWDRKFGVTRGGDNTRAYSMLRYGEELDSVVKQIRQNLPAQGYYPIIPQKSELGFVGCGCGFIWSTKVLLSRIGSIAIYGNEASEGEGALGSLETAFDNFLFRFAVDLQRGTEMVVERSPPSIEVLGLLAAHQRFTGTGRRWTIEDFAVTEGGIAAGKGREGGRRGSQEQESTLPTLSDSDGEEMDLEDAELQKEDDDEENDMDETAIAADNELLSRYRHLKISLLEVLQECRKIWPSKELILFGGKGGGGYGGGRGGGKKKLKRKVSDAGLEKASSGARDIGVEKTTKNKNDKNDKNDPPNNSASPIKKEPRSPNPNSKRIDRQFIDSQQAPPKKPKKSLKIKVAVPTDKQAGDTFTAKYKIGNEMKSVTVKVPAKRPSRLIVVVPI